MSKHAEFRAVIEKRYSHKRIERYTVKSRQSGWNLYYAFFTDGSYIALSDHCYEYYDPKPTYGCAFRKGRYRNCKTGNFVAKEFETLYNNAK